MTSNFLDRKTLLLAAVALLFLVLPAIASAQTWQHQFTDYNDLWCPVTDTNRTYTGTPNCTISNPEGQSCTGGSRCKVNTSLDNDGCGIQTDVYYCPSTPGCPVVELTPGSCTQTGSAWTTYNNHIYGGTLIQQIGAQPSTCMGSCQAVAGVKYCTQQRYRYNHLSTNSYTCYAYSGATTPTSQTTPPQTTVDPATGDPDTSTSYISTAYGPTYSCTSPTYGCAAAQAAPTASLSANPISVVQGSSSVLTYSSTNSTSCSISNGVGSVTPNTTGTSSVTPSANTTYTLTCTGAGGTATATATVAVTPPGLTASCNVSPSSINIGQNATWTASASGGTGSYTYSWSGTDSLSGSGSTASKTYNSAGTKTASVTVTSGSLQATVNCSTSLSVTDPNPPGPPGGPLLTCNVSPTTLPATGGTLTYTASPLGLVPYTWNDAMGGSYSTSRVISRTIPAGNATYAMTVSKSGYTSGTCPSVVVGTPSCGNANATLTANPTRVRADNNTGTTLTFNASGVDTSCVITGPGVNQTVMAASCSVPSATIHTPTITDQSVYRISCDGGEGTDDAVVNLLPKFIEF